MVLFCIVSEIKLDIGRNLWFVVPSLCLVGRIGSGVRVLHRQQRGGLRPRGFCSWGFSLQPFGELQRVRASVWWRRWRWRWREDRLRSTYWARPTSTTSLERRLPRRVSTLRRLPLTTRNWRPDVRTAWRDIVGVSARLHSHCRLT